MSTRFFKKPSPRQPVYVNGAPIMFEKVNIELGVYQTADEGIQREFAALQARGVGGIFDITQAEYDEIKKKQTDSPGSYRDEFGKAFTQQRIQPPNDLVSRAEDAKPVETDPPATNPAPVPPGTAPTKPLPRRRNQS